MQAIYLPGDHAFIRYIEIPGADPPLLWLHGWQCSATGELLPVGVQPALRGRRSLFIDFLGHGYSDKPADFGYTLAEHARTIVEVIDALGSSALGLVGHSMGGGVATLVAAARPTQVSLLIMAEGIIDPATEAPLDGQTEEQFVQRGFPGLIESQASEAAGGPGGLRAAHLGITSLIEPRALYREAVSMTRETDPSIRSLLRGLGVPRTFLIGELSDPEDLEADLAKMGVGWKTVPDTGHPMGLQNPAGFAQAIADVVAEHWTE